MASLLLTKRSSSTLRPARVALPGARQLASPALRLQRRVARQPCRPVAALEIDWSDPDTLVGLAGVVLGLVVGLGVPVFYINRMDKDEERLEELRAMNRATFEQTGEYMTEEEIKAFRTPKWTDRKEFVDDD